MKNLVVPSIVVLVLVGGCGNGTREGGPRETGPSYDRQAVYGACRDYWASGGGKASIVRARLGVTETDDFQLTMFKHLKAELSDSQLVEKCVDYWMSK